MVRQTRISIQWVLVAGLIGILGLGGCSKKNVSATSTGLESQESAAKTKGGRGQTSEDGRGQRGGKAGADLNPAPAVPRRWTNDRGLTLLGRGRTR